jgi:N-acetylneuraminic acid mutarotase
LNRSSLNEIRAILPLQTSGFYPGRDIHITVEVLEGQLEFGGTLHVNDAWFRLHDSPVYGSDEPYKRAFCRELDGKAYILSGDATSFFSFDPESGAWVELAPFTGSHRKYGTGFALGDAVYFGTGWETNCFKDWWKYDVVENTWTQKEPFDGGSRLAAVGFTAADWGYVGTGEYLNIYWDRTVFDYIWKYHPVTDNWTHMIDYPPDTLVSGWIWQGMYLGLAIEGDDCAYVGLGDHWSSDFDNRIFRYDPFTNSWEFIDDIPYVHQFGFSFGFFLSGNIYIKAVRYPNLYSYIESSQTWRVIKTGILTDVDHGIAFTIGGKAYLGLGGSSAMWEYDPARER